MLPKKGPAWALRYVPSWPNPESVQLQARWDSVSYFQVAQPRKRNPWEWEKICPAPTVLKPAQTSRVNQIQTGGPEDCPWLPIITEWILNFLKLASQVETNRKRAGDENASYRSFHRSRILQQIRYQLDNCLNTDCFNRFEHSRETQRKPLPRKLQVRHQAYITTNFEV
jgi:hypothetical protein